MKTLSEGLWDMEFIYVGSIDTKYTTEIQTINLLNCKADYPDCDRVFLNRCSPSVGPQRSLPTRNSRILRLPEYRPIRPFYREKWWSSYLKKVTPLICCFKLILGLSVQETQREKAESCVADRPIRSNGDRMIYCVDDSCHTCHLLFLLRHFNTSE